MEKTIILERKLNKEVVRFSRITLNYYIVSILIYFAFLFFSNIRVGVVSAVVMVFVAIEFILRNFKNNRITISKTSFLVLMYIIYNLFSILIGSANGYSITIGISEFSNAILPIIFYFIAIQMNGLEESKFIESFMKACLFTVIVGMFMYIVKPPIYFDYMRRTIVYYYLETYLAAPRMHSFLGSVVVGSISSMAFAFSMSCLILEKKSKRNMLMSIILLIGIILTSQRSAMGFAMIVIAIMGIYALKTKHSSSIRIIKYGVVIVIILAIAALVFPDLTNRTILRIASMSNAISERNLNWDIVWKQGVQTIVGAGLGTKGHRGIGLSAIIISDGNYIKMIYEIGIVGTMLFICIMVATLLRGLRNFKKCAAYLCIILGVLFQAIGSNVLGFQLVMPIFWYAIGRINCKNKP